MKRNALTVKVTMVACPLCRWAVQSGVYLFSGIVARQCAICVSNNLSLTRGVAQTEVIWAFGRLIANRPDMHSRQFIIYLSERTICADARLRHAADGYAPNSAGMLRDAAIEVV
ncbi:hypothetical protein MJK71_04420 [Escherichia coli]|nr:hypothetical protein MJK71_04420 [Escherichia coli]